MKFTLRHPPEYALRDLGVVVGRALKLQQREEKALRELERWHAPPAAFKEAIAYGEEALKQLAKQIELETGFNPPELFREVKERCRLRSATTRRVTKGLARMVHLWEAGKEAEAGAKVRRRRAALQPRKLL